MSNVIWTEPPVAKRGRSSTKWSAVADELRAKPNTWAMIGTVRFPSQASVISKTYKLKVVTRRNSDKVSYDMYAMHEVI